MAEMKEVRVWRKEEREKQKMRGKSRERALLIDPAAVWLQLGFNFF